MTPLWGERMKKLLKYLKGYEKECVLGPLFKLQMCIRDSRSIMSSYNKVNGTYANENAHLLKEILRDDWGFDGFVVTDWGADNDHALGVKNGSNLVMPAPGPDAAIGLVNAVKEGRVSEADLDERLKELFRVLVSADEAMKKAPKSFDKDAHHALARKCAEQSIVLLENDGILPLDWNCLLYTSRCV